MGISVKFLENFQVQITAINASEVNDAHHDELWMFVKKS